MKKEQIKIQDSTVTKVRIKGKAISLSGRFYVVCFLQMRLNSGILRLASESPWVTTNVIRVCSIQSEAVYLLS